MDLPLEGIRVVSLTVVWAGPFAEMFLADWGAEVIRVESTQHFMPTTRGRQARPSRDVAKAAPVQFSYVDDEPGARPWNRSALFNYHGRNKLSCTMDVMRPEGRELFKQLIARSDIFIENNSGGMLDRLGLGYPDLEVVNPQLIMISLPAFGNTGPYKDHVAFGIHQEAIGGHLWLMGYPDLGPETNPGTYNSDACSGTQAAFAILLALRHRRRTGRGQFIDMAQAEASLCHQADALLDCTLNGRSAEKVGNRHPSAAPCGVYHCEGVDEWIAITVYGDEDWIGFRRALGNPEWTAADRFSTTIGRWQHQDELDKLVEAWTSQRSDYEAMHSLQREGVAAGPAISNKDAFDDPHLLAREHFEEVHQVECGSHLTPTMLWRAANTPNKIRSAAPLLGEHNEHVYKLILGVSDEEYLRLEQEGHIGMDFAPHVK